MWSLIAWGIHRKEIPLMSHSPVSGIPFCTIAHSGHYRTLPSRFSRKCSMILWCRLARVRTEITIGGFFRCKSLLVPFEDSEFAAFSLTDGDIIQGGVILSMSKCAEERILQDIVLLTVT
jgi:hypothetical protein